MDVRDKHFYTKDNRQSVVLDVHISKIEEGELIYPAIENWSGETESAMYLSLLKKEPVWLLIVEYQTGMDQPTSSMQYCLSQEVAETKKQQYLTDKFVYPFDSLLKPEHSKFDANALSMATELSCSGRGEPPYSLIYEILHGAGLYESYHLSERVLRWIGDGKDTLKQRFGENWSCVAVLEYCHRHYGQYSLATLAARVKVADFISEDGFDAGYSSRELQVIYSGAEQLALRSIEAQANRNRGSGDASAEARSKRVDALLECLEELGDLFGRVDEDRLFEQAYDTVSRRRNDMPKSKKIRDSYFTEIRSTEPWRSRYKELRAKTA